MPDERFQVVIGAVDQASPVLNKFNQHLNTVQTTSQKAMGGLQNLANKSKWAFAAMGAAVAGATKVFADFENAMAKVATQLPGELMENYDEMAQAVQDMSIEFGQSTDVMAQGLYDILSAAIPADQSLQLLEQSAKTAAAGFTDVATTADLFTSIINAYGYAVEDAAEISDILFQSVFRGKMEFEDLANELGPIIGIAAQAEVSLEDITAAMATLTRQGIDTAEAATGIRQAILSFIDPTVEAQKAAEALGFELNASALASDGLVNSILKLQGASAEQVASLFGNVRALMAVQGILGDATGAMEDYALVTEAAGTTNEAFAKATDTTKFSIDQLKTSIQVLVQDFGEAMQPAIEEILGAFKDFIDRLRDMDDEQKRALGNLFINLTKVIGLVAGLNMLNRAIIGIGTAFGLAAKTIAPWLLVIEGAVVGLIALDKHSEEVVSTLEGVGKELGLVNEEMTKFYDQGVSLDPEIQELNTQIEGYTERLVELEEEMNKWTEAGALPPKEIRAEYERLTKELEPLIMELNKLTATQSEAEQELIKARQETEKFTEEKMKELETIEEEAKVIDEATKNIREQGDAYDEAAAELEQFREQLESIKYEAEWEALIAGAEGYDAQLLALQKTHEDTMRTIMAMPPELAKEKNEAILAVEKAYNVQVLKLEEERLIEQSRINLQAAIERAEEAQRIRDAEGRRIVEANEEEIRTRKEKYAEMERLEEEHFRRTAPNLEILVREHKAKYDEILNSFEWTQGEIARIQEIATTDLTIQLQDFVDNYIQGMEDAGASTEEVIFEVGNLMATFERLGVSREVISQLNAEFEAMPQNIEESKIATEDLIGIIGQIGDIAIGVSFGEKPTAGAIGGVVGGILGLFSGIPTWIGNLVNMVFGWIDEIQGRTQEMIDAVTGQFTSALTDFFMAPSLYDAVEGFGEQLNEIIYNMMVDAVVKALIASEAVQDAAKQLGKAINDYLNEEITLDQLYVEFGNFTNFMNTEVLPILEMSYTAMQPYNPYYQSTQTWSGFVPSYQEGGYVPYTGLALLHAGEYVVPKEENKAVSIGDVEININTTGGVDGTTLWQEFEREARRRGVELVR